jgi:hypothetical protein
MKPKKSEREYLVEARVFATNIFASLPLTVEAAALTWKSKIPFKALSLREVLIHRVSELAMVAVDLYECDKLVPAFIITRAVVETVAMTYWLSQKVGLFLDSKDIKELDEFLMKAMHGSRDSSTPLDSYNVLTAVDRMNKEYDGFRKMYDGLCEFAHPNWSGVLGAYGKVDHQRYSLSLGSKNSRVPIILGLAPFNASLKLFEHYYNDLTEQLNTLNAYFEGQGESE